MNDPLCARTSRFDRGARAGDEASAPPRGNDRISRLDGATSVSVIIPMWNEAAAIVETLKSLLSLAPDEVIVVDATSDDGAAELARGVASDRITVLSSARGRGVQQNVGARASSGDVLLFLHADCRLAPNAITAIRECVARRPNIAWGCLRMKVCDNDYRFRLIDAAAHLRSGMLGIAYGDQGIFMRRWAFEAVGGFPEIALMEDVFVSAELRRLGRPALVGATIEVSPRRWKKKGLIRQTLTNWTLTFLAAIGVSPGALARFYPIVR